MGKTSDASVGKDGAAGVEALAKATSLWVQEVIKGADAHERRSRAIEDESV